MGNYYRNDVMYKYDVIVTWGDIKNIGRGELIVRIGIISISSSD